MNIERPVFLPFLHRYPDAWTLIDCACYDYESASIGIVPVFENSMAVYLKLIKSKLSPDQFE